MNASLSRLPDVLRKVDSEEAPAFQWTTRSSEHQCRGCGAKVGQQVLESVIADTQSRMRHQRGLDLSPAADTAVLNLDTNLLAQSVDQINSIVEDPYLFGRIATLHALSDVVTLDARLHSAQVLITLPTACEDILERDLTQLMKGVVDTLDEHSCALLGGHTVQGTEMSLGLVVNAALAKSAALAPNGVTEGDVLILTKPIGNGTLFAGLMQGLARGKDVMNALPDMLASNQPTANVLRQHQCTQMTDVTGFGLLAHLEQLTARIELGTTLSLSAIPLHDGVLSLVERGCRSTLWPQNSQVLARISWHEQIDLSYLSLLCDPQTSGGLLAIVPADFKDTCLAALRVNGACHAAVIGSMTSRSGIYVDL